MTSLGYWQVLSQSHHCCITVVIANNALLAYLRTNWRVWLAGAGRAGARERPATLSAGAAERAAVGDAQSPGCHPPAHGHVHTRPDGHATHAARHRGLTQPSTDQHATPAAAAAEATIHRQPISWHRRQKLSPAGPAVFSSPSPVKTLSSLFKPVRIALNWTEQSWIYCTWTSEFLVSIRYRRI